MTSARAFAAAAAQLIRSNGHGGQASLARELGVSKGYLADLMSGRRHWPDPLKDRLAKHYGLTTAELLLVGEEFVRTGHWFPHLRPVAGTMPWSLERASIIWQIAARERKLRDSTFLQPQALKSWSPRLDDYLERRISDGELYSTARTYFQHLLADLPS